MFNPHIVKCMADKLRLASQDFRDLRFVPEVERWELVRMVLSNANKAVSDAMRNGALLEFRPPPPDERGSGSKTPVDDTPFNRLVGYFEVGACPEIKGHSRLFPGKMFDLVYESIYLGALPKVVETYDVSELQRKHSFVLLGYWSDACRQIVGWLYEELGLECECEGEGEESHKPKKPELRGPTQKKLVDVFWEHASWFEGGGTLNGLELCARVWDLELDSDEVDRKFKKLLPKTLNATNNSIDELRFEYKFHIAKGNVSMENSALPTHET